MEKTQQEAVMALLRRSGMYAPDIDVATLCAILLGQMRISFYGGTSSVPVLPTHFSGAGLLQTGETVAVIVVSRREMRSASVCFGETDFDLTPGEQFETPGADYPASLDELLFAAAELVEPLLGEAKKLCLCLDLPLTALADGESEIAAVPPELRLRGWEGAPLAQRLREELLRRGFADTAVSVGSVAAAALLGGIASARRPGRYLALNWGEGLRSAFAAPKSAVAKLGSGEKKLLVFDVGLGGFTGVPFATSDLTMDRDSAKPGHDLLEKMVSVHHLGERFRFTIISAVEERLLTFMCGRDFLSLRTLSLKTLLQFLEEPDGENQLARFCSHDENDREVALAVANAVLDRAARLVSASLIATILLVGAGRDEASPAIVSLAGAAFSAPLLRKKFAEQLETARQRMRRHIRFTQEEEPAMLGAAAALLLR